MSMDEASPEMVDGEMSEGPASRERLLKFEVQMYRLREGEYVVDFQVRATRNLLDCAHIMALSCSTVHCRSIYLLCRLLQLDEQTCSVAVTC